MTFTKELNDLKDYIDIELKKTLQDKNPYYMKLLEAIEYSVFSGGKRLRPIMNLKACELFNGDYPISTPYAIALEMIHTYSLIHDDLPSMDNDDFRRGKPTNHLVFGEAMAILAGDGLLNLGFETISNHISGLNTLSDYKKHTKALKEISKYSGAQGMIGGQVIDLLANHNTMTEEKLLFMYKTKTAALIQGSLVSGAIIGGATDIEVETIRDFGLFLGLAYQIRDDILDVDEDSSIKKLTYLTYHSIEKSKNDLIIYSNKAIESLERLKGRDISFFVWLTEKLTKRNM